MTQTVSSSMSHTINEWTPSENELVIKMGSSLNHSRFIPYYDLGELHNVEPTPQNLDICKNESHEQQMNIENVPKNILSVFDFLELDD